MGGARAHGVTDLAAVRGLLLAALDDPQAGIIGVAEEYYSALDSATRRTVERRYRPVVVPIPTRVMARPEEVRRAALRSVLRRAIGLRVVLEGDRSARG